MTNFRKSRGMLGIALLFTIASGSFAADSSAQVAREFLDDLPAAVTPRSDSRARSPGRVVTAGPYVSVQVNVDALGQNIVGDAANESSIAVNPANPGNMVIGWRQFDSIASNFREGGWRLRSTVARAGTSRACWRMGSSAVIRSWTLTRTAIFTTRAYGRPLTSTCSSRPMAG